MLPPGLTNSVSVIGCLDEMGQRKAKILLVDDEATNLQLLKDVLDENYQLFFAKEGKKALEICQLQQPDLLLLDIMMPGMNGYEVLEELKQSPKTRQIPVIFVTAVAELDDEAYGLNLGAVDYITKPINSAIVRARVKTHLSLVKADELHDTRLQIIHSLGHAAEYKDNETGLHVIRMSHYSRILGTASGMSDEAADELLNAAPMHDIGKIGIPDSILLKPGKLDADEWKIMQRHPQIGAEIIGEHQSSLLKLAATIAHCHHEKWNGKGYPRGLSKQEIPLAARIVAVADVFDALTTERPYKKAWEVDAAVKLILSEAGEHFDPDVVALFQDNFEEFMEVKNRWKETVVMPHSDAAVIAAQAIKSA